MFPVSLERLPPVPASVDAPGLPDVAAHTVHELVDSLNAVVNPVLRQMERS